jgi:hypothetical protein
VTTLAQNCSTRICHRQNTSSVTKGKPVFGLDPENSDGFREALKAKKIKACIPPRSNRKVQHAFSKTMYKQRHRFECMFEKLKDWRRIATRGACSRA